MKKYTKEELYSRDRLRMSDLRKFIDNHKDIPDNVPVLLHRVEDYYFEKVNWAVWLHKGFHWFSTKRMNEKMEQEKVHRAAGKKTDYPKIEDPDDHITPMTDELKEQYMDAHCIFTNKEEDLIFITPHY